MIAKIKSLKNHQGFMKYFKNTSWLLAEKILRLSFGLIVGIWVARYLGPEQYGFLSFAQSFVGLFAVLATLGLDVIIVRELVKNKSNQDTILGTSFLLKLVGSFVAVFLLIIFSSFLSNDGLSDKLIYIIAISIIFQSFTVIDFYFQSCVRSKYVAIVNIFSAIVSSLIKIMFILFDAPLIAFAIIISIDTMIVAVGYVIYYFRDNLSIFSWKFDAEYAKSLLKDSWPLIVSGFIYTVYMKIDQIMIKELMDASAVGQYAAAVRLSEAWYFVPMVIASSIYPAIINAKKEDTKQYYLSLQKLYNYMVIGAIITALLISFTNEWIIDFLYGSQYNQAANVLVLHVWAGLFVALGIASGKWFLTENLQSILMINTAIGAISNILMNYYLINQFGIVGAAVSTLISYSLATYFSLLLFKKTRFTFMQMTKSIFLLALIKNFKISPNEKDHDVR